MRNLSLQDKYISVAIQQCQPPERRQFINTRTERHVDDEEKEAYICHKESFDVTV